jgi:proteasome assembly chaperone 3
MSVPQPFPVQTRQLRAAIGGCETDILLSGYADRVLIVVTQVGSLGTVMQAEKETVLGGGSTYRVETLMGRRDDPMLELCTRQLAERLAEAECARPLVVCLGLRPSSSSLEAVRQIVQAVLENPVW